MKAMLILPAAALALALSACSHKTGDDAAATANSAMNDTSANFNSMSDATSNAADSAKPALNDAGNAIGNAADATGQAATDAGNSISNSTK